MSFNEGIEAKLYKRHILDAEIAAHLINNPSCLDNNPQKEEAYQIAIDYFASRREECVSKEVRISNNWAEALKLGVLIDEAIEAAERKNDSKKRKYAIKIAQYLIDNSKSFLRLIPEETLNMAVQIVIQYLEEAMGS